MYISWRCNLPLMHSSVNIFSELTQVSNLCSRNDTKERGWTDRGKQSFCCVLWNVLLSVAWDLKTGRKPQREHNRTELKTVSGLQGCSKHIVGFFLAKQTNLEQCFSVFLVPRTPSAKFLVNFNYSEYGAIKIIIGKHSFFFKFSPPVWM
jgi:hypothetical protein